MQNPCDILSGKKMCFQIDHAVGREHHKGYTCKDNEKRKRKFLFSYEKREGIHIVLILIQCVKMPILIQKPNKVKM